MWLWIHATARVVVHAYGIRWEDVLPLPLTESGNQYVVIFLDYLTKWVEAFAVPDQSDTTIAKLLVEEIFCRHGAPEHLLSDRGANFLYSLIQDVCNYLNVKRYHPQTDGLVERFNSICCRNVLKGMEKIGTSSSHMSTRLLDRVDYLPNAWLAPKEHITRARQEQKQQYDNHTCEGWR